jgi:LuxR family transcriptional regulator, maltose regulon positive regulatory protein
VVSASESQPMPQPPRIFVPRPRLDDVISEAVTRPVTALVAPAGAGKTTSLARWATRPHAPPVHWLSAPLADPVAALAAALTAAVHQEPDSQPAAGASGRALDLLARLAASTQPPDVIVIDDAHRLPKDAWALLETVVGGAPEHVRLLLAGRRDTPLATVKLGLSDSITVLRADVLRFDDDEASQLVTAHAPDASGEDIRTLQARAQGWAAALVLGARTLAAAVDRSAARAKFTHTERPVLDYLLGEVFLTLPAATRHLLLCTCDEDLITEETATLLSVDLDAGARLAGLAMDGMLVTSYRSTGSGSEKPAWRFHPLLRELLRRQTAVDGPDHALAVAAHVRAAHYYAIHGPVLEAIRHAAAIGYAEMLVELLVEEGPGLMSGGHQDELCAGLRALPDDVIAAHPALLGVLALSHRGSGEFEMVNRLAERAIRAASIVRRDLARPEGAVTAPMPAAADLALVADAALLRAWQVRFSWANARDAVRDARDILGCTNVGAAADRDVDVSTDVAGAHGHEHRWPLAPARAAWLLHELAGTEIWVGDLGAAEQHVGETLVTAQALGQHRMVAAALANRAVLEMLDARFQTAAGSATQCLAAAARAGRVGPLQDAAMARAHLALAWAAYYDIRFADAKAALVDVAAIERRASDPLVATLFCLLSARLSMEAGDVDEARRLLDSAPVTPEPAPGFLVWLTAAARADQALLANDLTEARRQGQVMREAGVSTDDAILQWLLTDLDRDTARAVALLDEALRNPATGPHALVASIAAVYRTRIYLREGELAAAEAMLRDALTRMAPQHSLYPLVRLAASDPAMRELLGQVAKGPSPHPFAGQALAALHRYRYGFDDPVLAATAAARVPGQRSAPASTVNTMAHAAAGRTFQGRSTPAVLTVALTDREGDVLRELALGGSYQDIAKTLYVTENTVKTHLASLYRKLGADRRASALRRARDVGLL